MVQVVKSVIINRDTTENPPIVTNGSLEFASNNAKTFWQCGHPTYDPTGQYDEAAAVFFDSFLGTGAWENDIKPLYPEPPQEEGLTEGGGEDS